jgi:hypothetical protein
MMALAMLLTGCGGDGSAPTGSGAKDASAANVIRIDATEYSYSMPPEATGGVVTFESANVGAQPHEFAFTRIDADKTVKDLVDALNSGKDPSKFRWIHYFPGVPILSPGEKISMTREVEDEGTYVVFCALPTPQGRPHYEHGMIGSFEVAGRSTAELPMPDAAIVATDNRLEAPSLPAGERVLELKSEGTTDHQFWLWAFRPGKDNKDVDAWIGSGMQGPAPATFLGGIKDIPPGTSVFLGIDLKSATTYTIQDFGNGLRADFAAR